MKCSECGDDHDLDELELGFDRPDVYAALSADEKAKRAQSTSDLCIIDGDRHFLRGILPIACEGHDEPFCIGIWVETSRQAYQRYVQLYRDPDQGNEPPFPGRLANDLAGYPRVLGLAVQVQLVNAKKRPHLTLTNAEHPLAVEQRTGITRQRALELLIPYLHPIPIRPPRG